MAAVDYEWVAVYRRKGKQVLFLAAPYLNVAVCLVSPVNGYLRYADSADGLYAGDYLLVMWLIAVRTGMKTVVV